MDQIIRKRLAFRIADRLPKVLRILYYIVLFMTLIYVIYRFLEWILVTIQKIGEFVFRPQNYWAAVVSIFVLLIGAFLLAQFVLGLDPVGHARDWLLELIRQLETGYL